MQLSPASSHPARRREDVKRIVLVACYVSCINQFDNGSFFKRLSGFHMNGSLKYDTLWHLSIPSSLFLLFLLGHLIIWCIFLHQLRDQWSPFFHLHDINHLIKTSFVANGISSLYLNLILSISFSLSHSPLASNLKHPSGMLALL